MDPISLINFIVWYATKIRGSVSRIRLMKFLYLADWHNVKLTGQSATPYPWRFYHYGPYATEAQRDIDLAAKQGLIEAKILERPEEDDVNLYCRYGDDPEIWREIGVKADSFLRREIDCWIAKPLPEFLDYVYFETEPMAHAKRGELLDLSVIKPYVEPTPSPPLKGKPSTEIRDKVRGFLERASRTAAIGPAPIYDEIYEKAVEFLDEQDSLSEELHGQVGLGEDSSLTQTE